MDNIILKNKYYRVFFAGLLVILVFPLLNIQPWLSPPAWGKTVLFRILFSILLYFLFYLIFSRKDGENLKPYFKTVLTDRFNPLFWPFWLLISLTGLYILATVFSLDPHYSFWGSPQRAGGSLNFILYILFSFFAFIIVKGKDWSRVWNFVFIVAGIESLISIFQKAGTFSSILIPRTEQVIGTMGSSILLGLFLLIPFFMALAFAIRAHGKKKIFYLACLFLYFAAIILTASRAAIMGLFWGTLFFIFTYPSKTKKLKSAKISLIVLILAGIAFAFWLNAKPALVESFKANSVLGIPFTRVWNTARPFLDVKNISFEKVATDSRFSGWKVLYPAVKERPLFGFGPENVSIAFDKYYEPLLPGFRLHDWWDKAHNFALDMAVGAGVPALAVYLSFLGVLFWRLRKLKGALSQGIQSAFAAYLTADFFGFDAFSTYLVFFLGVGFAFSLIAKKDIVPVLSRRSYNLPLWKSGFSFVLFCLLLLFIWNAGLKPLKMNKELNMAD
ncbi:MAG: O-antigen ligase family protein, partial [bacterium]|nr:O-antigen ligase family protein [bacterium]